MTSRSGRPRVAVLIPAMNEEATVGGVVRELRQQLAPIATLVGVIVAADRCTDQTAAASRAEGAITIELDEHSSRGLGDTFRALVNAAVKAFPHADLFLHIDSDGQYAAADAASLVKAARSSSGDVLVVGNRLAKRPLCMSRTRYMLNRMMSQILTMCLRTQIADSQSGLRLFTPHVAAAPTTCPHTYTQEQLISAHRARVPITFIDIGFDSRAFGHSRVVPTIAHYAVKTVPRVLAMLFKVQPSRWLRVPPLPDLDSAFRGQLDSLPAAHSAA